MQHLIETKCIISKYNTHKEIKMAKPQQTASELSRTLAGQWTKSEKRAHISRQMMESKKRTHAALKAFKQNQILNK